MSEVTFSLDGVSSSTIPEIVVEDVTRQIVPSVRDSYLEVPGRSGSWLFEEEAGDRPLGIRVALVGESVAERREAVRKAARFIYAPGRRKLIISDEPDRFLWAKIADAPRSDELLARGRFEATFRTGPFAESTAISTATVAASGNLVVPDEDGLADFFEPVVVVTATGPVSGWTITTNGVALSYGSAMTSGAKVTVSTIAATVTTGDSIDTELVGLFNGANLAMTAVDGDFPKLSAGANPVVLSAGISTAWKWRARYV